jgi:tight adherence protein B
MFNFNVDARTIVIVLVAAAVFAASQAAWGLLRAGKARRTVNRRLVVSERGLSIGELVVELRKQRGLNDEGQRGRGWAWMSDLIVRSGVVYQPQRWALVFAAIGIAAAAGVLVATHNIILAPIVGAVVSAVAPVIWLKMKAAKRAKMIGLQLPDALEIIVRSLEAGHPVPTAVALVGREMPDPIGSEFGMASDEIAYGATLELAVGHIADRCRHPDVDLFAASIRLQERSGGNLTGLLKMNAKTIRERVKMRMKIKAASSEGRASALILTAVPFVVMGILQLVSPHFYGDVIHLRGVQIGLGCLGVWMLIGNMVMRKMIDMRI